MKARLNADNLLSMLFLCLIWGSSYILIKKALLFYEVREIAALRIGISCLLVLPFFPQAFRSIQKHHWPWVFLTGILGSALPALLFAIATTRVGSAVNGVLNALSPLFTLLSGILLFKEPFKPARFAGVLLGLAGAAWLILLSGKSFSSETPLYALLPVLATLCYGISSNIVRHKIGGLSPFHITTAAMTLTGIPLLIWAGLHGTFGKILSSSVALQHFGYLAILSIFGTFIAWLVFYRLVQRTDALFGMSVTYLIPLVAIAWGLADGEAFPATGYAALLFILSGVWLSSGMNIKNKDNK